MSHPMKKLSQRQIAQAFDVPPWLMVPGISKTPLEVLRWKFRWLRKLWRGVSR